MTTEKHAWQPSLISVLAGNISNPQARGVVTVTIFADTNVQQRSRQMAQLQLAIELDARTLRIVRELVMVPPYLDTFVDIKDASEDVARWARRVYLDALMMITFMASHNDNLGRFVTHASDERAHAVGLANLTPTRFGAMLILEPTPISYNPNPLDPYHRMG